MTRFVTIAILAAAPAPTILSLLTINIDLSQSIRLARGESLFVAVELMQDADLGMCLAGVAVALKDQLRQFVSPSMAAPFQWNSFDSFGAQSTRDITAYGHKVR